MVFKLLIEVKSTQEITTFQNVGSPMTKCHLDVAFVVNHREYYKGLGGGFPQIQIVVSLVIPYMLVACPCIKNVPTMH
jgi:hypothetical protein